MRPITGLNLPLRPRSDRLIVKWVKRWLKSSESATGCQKWLFKFKRKQLKERGGKHFDFLATRTWRSCAADMMCRVADFTRRKPLGAFDFGLLWHTGCVVFRGRFFLRSLLPSRSCSLLSSRTPESRRSHAVAKVGSRLNFTPYFSY